MSYFIIIWAHIQHIQNMQFYFTTFFVSDDIFCIVYILVHFFQSLWENGNKIIQQSVVFRLSAPYVLHKWITSIASITEIALEKCKIITLTMKINSGTVCVQIIDKSTFSRYEGVKNKNEHHSKFLKIEIKVNYKTFPLILCLLFF